MTGSYFRGVRTQSFQTLAALLARPLPEDEHHVDVQDHFDPWQLFPCLYGSYDAEFDKCAIDVLKELRSGVKIREDLGAEMFREMLCRLKLCEYGTSPRYCFPDTEFRRWLHQLIEKWEAWATLQWGDDWRD